MTSRPRSIGIVGSGPMAGYTLRHLIANEAPLAITVFEAHETAGCGMPYRAGMNADEMYCNAFSREIPVFTRRLTTWLKDQSDIFLHGWDLTRDDIDARAFYPRVLLGEYLSADFADLCAKGRAAGHEIEVKTRHNVEDIQPDGARVRCTVAHDGQIVTAKFDDVVIATGHVWPAQPQIDGVNLTSPWPCANITRLAPVRLGVLGSSLSAIDVVVALALQHGEFTERDGHVAWYPAKGADDLHVTMVSHNGIMPEPDFHYPYPYEPLRHITPEVVAGEIAKGTDGLLGRVFDLLIAELRAVDPEYLDDLGPDAETIEGFCAAYVRQRKNLGGLRALRATLQTAIVTFEAKETQAYRYALLRGHERFEPLLDILDDADRELFSAHLAPVFADCYAAIPHISVRRVLALQDAGVLELVATQEGATFTAGPEGISIDTIDGPLTFSAMIDARGQAPATLGDLPFPGLVQGLCDVDAPLLAPYRLNMPSNPAARIYCLAIPQILARNPFAQGLANCADLSRRAVTDLLAHGAAGGRTH